MMIYTFFGCNQVSSSIFYFAMAIEVVHFELPSYVITVVCEHVMLNKNNLPPL